MPTVSFNRCTALMFAALTAASPAALCAATQTQGAAEKDIAALVKAFNEQKKRLSEQEKLLEKQQKALDEQQQQFRALQAQIAKMSGEGKGTATATKEKETPKNKAAGEKSTAEADKKTTAATGSQEEVGTDRKPVEKERPPEIAAVIEEGGVLLPKGKLVITPSIEYSRSSATRVAIEGFSIIPALNIGVFEVAQVGRDTITAALGTRLGITNRIEVEAKVPYLYRRDSTRSRPFGAGSSSDVLSTVNGSDIGDVEFGAHYQINNGKNGWPFFIGNLRFKTVTGTSPFEVGTDRRGLQTELPTGSGFYAIQPSLTAIYPTDPAVFFSNIGYVHNFARSFDTVGEIAPGDSISTSFGMSLALNDRSSFSLGYSHSMVFETEQNGERIPNSTYLQVGTLDLGYSYTLTPRIGLNLNVSAGITEDAPDSRITLRIPIAYDLF